MEIIFSRGVISFSKQLGELDKFVVKFVSVLDELGIRYVLISGYVSILFGRNRSSEDIDLFLEKISFSKFEALWKKLGLDFECINAFSAKEAYAEYLAKGGSIRFAFKNQVIPNMEVKYVKTELDLISLSERVQVLLNGGKLFISPLELQVSFKLYLGSEKDIEDAKYLFALFKEKLDLKALTFFNKKLGVEKSFVRYLM